MTTTTETRPSTQDQKMHQRRAEVLYGLALAIKGGWEWMDTGAVWWAMSDLPAESQLSYSAVQNHLHHLTQMGLVVRSQPENKFLWKLA